MVTQPASGEREEKKALKNKQRKGRAANAIAINRAAQDRKAQGGFKSCEIPKCVVFLFFKQDVIY